MKYVIEIKMLVDEGRPTHSIELDGMFVCCRRDLRDAILVAEGMTDALFAVPILQTRCVERSCQDINGHNVDIFGMGKD